MLTTEASSFESGIATRHGSNAGLDRIDRDFGSIATEESGTHCGPGDRHASAAPASV